MNRRPQQRLVDRFPRQDDRQQLRPDRELTPHDRELTPPVPPEFDIHVVYAGDGLPHFIRLTWIRYPDNLENVVGVVIATLRRRLIHEIQEYQENSPHFQRVWDDDEILRRVDVRLGAYLPEYDRDFTPWGELFPWIRLNDLNPDHFDLVINRMAESNMNLEFQQIHWTLITLLNSIRVGNGAGGIPSKWISRGLNEGSILAKGSLNGYNDRCCATVAFLAASRTFLLNKFTNLSNCLRSPEKLKKFADALQKELHWPFDVSLKDLPLIVQTPKTSHIRLVLLSEFGQAGRAFLGPNYQHDFEKPAANTIYMIRVNNHYVGVNKPNAFYQKLSGNHNRSWCDDCLFFLDKNGHECSTRESDDPELPKKKAKKSDKCPKCALLLKENHICRKCHLCEEILKTPHHLCDHFYCGSCVAFIPKTTKNHGCPVFESLTHRDKSKFIGEGYAVDEFEAVEVNYIRQSEDDDEEETGEIPEIDPTKGCNVWAYDLECAMNYVQKKEEISDVEYQGTVITLERQIRDIVHDLENQPPNENDIVVHQPNLIIAKNVFIDNDAEAWIYENTITEFIRNLRDRPGTHICIAHNASGYDSRLIFSVLCRIMGVTPQVIFRGTKIIYMKCGKLIFLDSLLHLQGSLARLGKEFGLDENLLKGHFPHKLNKIGRNQNYIGDIPSIEQYIDERFISSQDELDELKEWYSRQPRKNWNLRKELIKYCKQDVEVLAQLLKIYHNDIKEISEGLSPLSHATSAGLAHKIFLKVFLPKHLEAHCIRDNLTNGVPCCAQFSVDPKIQEKQKLCFHYDTDETWIILNPEEYFFARDALRGGRTDIRQTFFTLDDAALARGEEIRYIDIVSMYPFVQIDCDYPVGPPEVIVYTKDPQSPEPYAVKMSYEYQPRHEIRKRKTNYTRIVGQPSPEELKSFFGFILADVTPPKDLFHPILVHYDSKENKCIASLEKIRQNKYPSNAAVSGKRTVFTSIEFQLALENGYQVDWVYCIHKYKRKKSLWSDMMKKLASLKISSSGIPENYTEQELRDAYLRRFEIELEPVIANLKARKAIAKRLINSVWGKNCENKYQEITTILNNHKNLDKLFDFEIRDQRQRIHITDMQALSDDMTLIKYRHNKLFRAPNINSSYVPASVFVPAHGRVMLWKALNDLGKRVLMHDTDSIIYHHIPGDHHKPPPSGSLLGDWELDDIHTKEKGLIFEFLGLGPKSYGLAYQKPDGSIKTQVKMKGISLKLSTKHQFNYHVMKDIILGRRKDAIVRQCGFGYLPHLFNGTIRTIEFNKIISQNNSLKGVLKKDEHRIYPKGYAADDWVAPSEEDDED